MEKIADTILEKIIHELEQNPRIAMAFLFGSHAKGIPRPDSDLDVAVYFTEPFELCWIQEVWGQLESLSGKEVDLIVLNNAPATICWSALRGMKLTIKDQEQYLKFMLDCSREAEDFQEFIFDLWRLRQQYQEVDHVTTHQ